MAGALLGARGQTRPPHGQRRERQDDGSTKTRFFFETTNPGPTEKMTPSEHRPRSAQRPSVKSQDGRVACASCEAVDVLGRSTGGKRSGMPCDGDRGNDKSNRRRRRQACAPQRHSKRWMMAKGLDSSQAEDADFVQRARRREEKRDMVDSATPTHRKRFSFGWLNRELLRRYKS